MLAPLSDEPDCLRMVPAEVPYSGVLRPESSAQHPAVTAVVNVSSHHALVATQ